MKWVASADLVVNAATAASVPMAANAVSVKCQAYKAFIREQWIFLSLIRFLKVRRISYWPLFNRPLRTKTTFQFLSKGPVKKRPVKVGPVKLKAG